MTFAQHSPPGLERAGDVQQPGPSAPAAPAAISEPAWFVMLANELRRQVAQIEEENRVLRNLVELQRELLEEHGLVPMQTAEAEPTRALQ